MKAINKFFYALLAFATVGMVACSEDNTYEPGAPEVEGCYDVYFPDANTLETQGPTGDVSLDPTEATEFAYTLYRNNTDGEIVVPVNVTKNTAKATIKGLKKNKVYYVKARAYKKNGKKNVYGSYSKVVKVAAKAKKK